MKTYLVTLTEDERAALSGCWPEPPHSSRGTRLVVPALCHTGAYVRICFNSFLDFHAQTSTQR